MTRWPLRLLALVAGLLLSSSLRAPHDLVAHGYKGAVASAEPHATAVGMQVLKQGGNAVDAAVAVALALAVTHPQAGNLGGGGFMVIRMADGRTAAIDFRERAPGSASADMYLKPDGTVDTDKVQFGASASGVPGSPAGLCLALEKFGSKPLAQLAAPAIRLAHDGFPVDQFLATALREEQAQLSRFPSTRKIFFHGNVPLQQGELLLQGDLAQTLERFALTGHAGFYTGRTAELITAAMQQGGGFVSAQDLAGYAAKERPVQIGNYRGREVLTMPPPSSGGVALLQMLNLLEPSDLRGLGFGGSQYCHLLTEVMQRAYADRSRWLGDSDHYPVPVEGLISKEYAAMLRKSIRTDRKSEVVPGLPPGGKESDDTTHFSIVDEQGNAVACTTTINSTFGAMCVVEGAGFLLNNEMDDFSAKPSVPNQFGLVGGKANAIAPNKRMLSSMTPTIVLLNGKVELVLGSPGGSRIINSVLQVMLNVVDHGMPIDQAVRAPRIHHQWLPNWISYEAQAISPDVRAKLESMGHMLAKTPMSIGQVSAIQILQSGERFAVADHRGGGSAAAF
ncbi:MAG: gamma-glutamyltransferase [Planctomycetes bacterium]|nr:gamma-glutamyltransferase [Planctomycetota bacterium]